MKNSLFSILILAIYYSASAQTFTPNNLDIEQIDSDGALDVGDYDNDGDLDLVITGQVDFLVEDNVVTGGVGFTGIYKNDNGQFTLLSNLSLIEARLGDVVFGDLDNDGDLDLIVSGSPTGPNTSNSRVIAVYKNDGEDTFVEVPTELIAFNFGDIELVDFNKDGLVDVAITGSIEGEFGSEGFADIFLNDGDFVFTRQNVAIEQVGGSSNIDFIDLEKDGDLDVILTGFTDTDFKHKTFFYVNDDGNYSLTDLGMPNLSASSIGIQDLDNNGYDDIILAGGEDVAPFENIFRIFLNDNGSLTNLSTELSGTEDGNFDFSDFDNDGDLDILLTGDSGPSVDDPSITQIIINENGEGFTLFATEFDGSFRGGAKWGDYDNDGDVDFIKIQGSSFFYELNSIPDVEGTSASLTTAEETGIIISINDLIITDPDNSFPDDFMLSVSSGDNYTVSDENQVTPATDFNGSLTIPVTVNDGIDDSQPFQLTVDVTAVNDVPVITAAAALTTPEEAALLITIDDTTIEDPDSVFPNDFTLSISSGDNYTVSDENQVTPATDFNGSLTIPVTVNDGIDDSQPFQLTVDVTAVNDIPVITAAAALTTPEETVLLISIDDITIEDPDNVFPDDFTLNVFDGENYTVSDSEISPETGYIGILLVPVSVNDGTDESEQFTIEVDVTKILGTSRAFGDIKSSIYPNPVTNHLNIDLTGDFNPNQLRVYNIAGKLMYSLTLEGNNDQIQLDLSMLEKGSYLLKLTSHSQIINFNLIKE